MVFELSITNKDKGEIDEDQLVDRIAQFKEKKLDLIVTQKPMFFEKAQLIRNSCFAIGYDTFIRLIDKKYYNNETSILLSELIHQKQIIGTTFAVGGRLNPRSNNFEKLCNCHFKTIMLSQIGTSGQDDTQECSQPDQKVENFTSQIE